jgi:hypothetical protein
MPAYSNNEVSHPQSKIRIHKSRISCRNALPDSANRRAKQFFSGIFRLPRVEGPSIFPDCGSMVELSEQATLKL